MKDLAKPIAKTIFYLLAVILLVWTASLTLSFIGRALPEIALAKYFALAVFDVGAVAWLLVFLSSAEGIGQRVTAILATVFDLVGIGLMVAAETILGGQNYVQIPENLGAIAIWGIAVWTFVNVLAVFAFHILDVEVQKSISIKSAHDKIQAQALAQLDKRADEIAEETAQILAERMINETLLSLSVMQNGAKERNPTKAGGG
jgi:hypothetical protein